jgi:hypothetical protein|tara:strand:+ start:2809 stop:3876 length:1068 start_codon:yes stop_codon:yes gene_type:complete
MTTHHTTLGFEIEFKRTANLDNALQNIRQAGRDNNKPALTNVVDERHRYNTSFFTDRWVQGYDCSCGWEIKSHPLTDTAEVEAVMKGIRQAGGTVDRSCGLHVHVGIAHLSLEGHRRLAKLYARYELALDSLLPRSRRGSSAGYAHSNYTTITGLQGVEGFDLSTHFSNLDRCGTKRQVQRTANPRGKYSKMNLQAYNSKTTVEFRGHQGTLNFRKIDSWVSLLAKMVKLADESSQIIAKVATFSEMLDELVGTTAQIEASNIRRPKAGTKGAQIWAAMDELYSNSFRNVFPVGGGVNHGVASGMLMTQLGFAQGTVRTAITQWSQHFGMTRRPSGTRSGLRSYLEGRRTTLANR